MKVSFKRAQEIMGKNLFGLSEGITHFGFSPSQEQLREFVTVSNEIPFSEEMLLACKDTYILILVLPLSIFDIRGLIEKKGGGVEFDSGLWYYNEPFAKDKSELNWQLIRKEAIKGSLDKNWKDQQSLLSEDEEVPKASIVVYTILGHFLAVGERLFKNIYVHCIDQKLNTPTRIVVGHFEEKRINFSCWYDEKNHDSVGLISMKKH